MKRMLRVTVLVLAAALLLGAMPGYAAFSDVPEDNWNRASIDQLVSMGIVRGYEDGCFRPQDKLTHGAFLKLLSDSMFLDMVGNPQKLHWAASSLDAAVELGITSYEELPRTVELLESEISRYEMSRLIVRGLRILYDKGWAETTGVDEEIADYDTIPEEYREYVGQAWRLGLIGGYEDGCFHGERSLSRGEACVVITRTLDLILKIEEDSFSEKPPKPETPERPTPDGYVPIAKRSKAEFNQAVFGDANVTWHPSYEDAQARWTDVTVNVWRLRSDGSKYADTMTMTVNKGVAEEVKGIFQMIFEGEEKFPISYVCTVRKNTSDTRSEHMWGVAIDINPVQNYYCYKASGQAIVGDYWKPYEDPYSVTPDGDVVKAFAAYGWGWGGDGRWSRTQDYMHFSITGT